MKTFNEYQIIEASKSECQKKFEKYLFGTFRKKGEIDTKQEDEIFKKLQIFIGTADSGRRQRPDIVDAIEDLKDCKQYYRDILIPKAKIVYRAGSIPTKLLQKQHIKAVTYGPGQSFEITGYTYKPNNKVQSWSSNWTIATDFIKNAYGEKRAPCFYKAKVDSTFLMTAKFMNTINAKLGFKYGGMEMGESEILRISKAPIKVTCIIRELSTGWGRYIAKNIMDK